MPLNSSTAIQIRSFERKNSMNNSESTMELFRRRRLARFKQELTKMPGPSTYTAAQR
jgi:hypothetical protein